MSLRRFYVPPGQIRDDIALLPAGPAHHLRHVLRLSAGALVEVFDGEGRAWAGRVEFVGGEVRVLLQEPLAAAGDAGPQITLALALIRQERFEWALEKSTELGVTAIVPLETRLSEVRIPVTRIAAKLGRWERIARESARQCERATVPRIRAPMTPAELFQLPEIAGSSKLWLHERTLEQPRFADAVTTVVCVGPEGGWHEDETAAARAAGCSFVSLGRRILRSETAAVAALAILQCGQEGVKPS